MSSKHMPQVEEITNFIAEQAGKRLDPEYPLLDGSILDSILLVELIVFIEETYQMEVSSEHLDEYNFGNILKICRFISQKQIHD